MAEYIDREAYCEKHCRCNSEYCDKASCPIWRVPAADVKPAVRAKWKRIGKKATIFECTACNKCEPHVSDYCPNCGARMDGEG